MRLRTMGWSKPKKWRTVFDRPLNGALPGEDFPPVGVSRSKGCEDGRTVFVYRFKIPEDRAGNEYRGELTIPVAELAGMLSDLVGRLPDEEVLALLGRCSRQD